MINHVVRYVACFINNSSKEAGTKENISKDDASDSPIDISTESARR